MQQHQSESSLPTALPSHEQTACVILSSPSDLNAFPEAVTNRIEDYLDHVCAPLVAQVPFATRREWRGEMQTHLESLTWAHIELGDASDVAVEHALTQFGTSQTVSRQWEQEWEQTGQSNAFAPSLQVARQWYGGALGLTAVLLFLTGDLINQGRSGSPTAALLYLIMPLIVGVGIGRLARNPVKASLTAMSHFALPLLLLYTVVFTYSKGFYYIHWDEVHGPWWRYWRTLQEGFQTDHGYGIKVGSFAALLQMVCWTVIGVPVAAITLWTHHTLLPRLSRLVR